MESLGTVTCGRCGTIHEIVRINGQLAIKSESNVNFERSNRKYIIGCVKCRALIYIGDKVSSDSPL